MSNLQEQYDAISAAPVVFIGIVIVVATISWYSARWFFNHRHEGLRERADGWKEENERLKRRNDEAQAELTSAKQELDRYRTRIGELEAELPSANGTGARQSGTRSSLSDQVRIEYSRLQKDYRESLAERQVKPAAELYPLVESLLLSLQKEKGIGRLPLTASAAANTRNGMELLSRIMPLLKAGHDEEARQKARTYFAELTTPDEDIPF